MPDAPVHVLAVAGSNNANSATAVVIRELAAQLTAAGCSTDVLDLFETPLPLLNPETTWGQAYHAPLKERVSRADIVVLGSPDYHGGMSGALKNFLDHFWTEFAGKLFGTVVASHEKGLTVHDQLRTVARQCYAWVMPYGLSLNDKADLADGKVSNPVFAERLAMFARDARVYGGVLARQRALDLAGKEPGFLARYRGKV